ncbi:hypothetical protein [Halobacteriovorax sp.]|uniref:hypothetical protein n=1 Tax=Halobacteriovorax sp. TaxID=2020862 RepID=UPI003569AE29
MSYFFYTRYQNINNEFLETSGEVERIRAQKILFEKRLKEVEKSEREIIKKLKEEKFKKVTLAGDFCTSGKEQVLVNASEDGVISVWTNISPNKPFNRVEVAPALSGIFHVLDRNEISLSTLKAEKPEDIKNKVLKILSLKNDSIMSFSANESGEEEVFSKKNCSSLKNIKDIVSKVNSFSPEYCSSGVPTYKVKFDNSRFKVFKLANKADLAVLPIEAGVVVALKEKEAEIKTIFSNQEEVNKTGTLVLSYSGNNKIIETFYNKKYPQEIFSPKNCQ